LGYDRAPASHSGHATGALRIARREGNSGRVREAAQRHWTSPVGVLADGDRRYHRRIADDAVRVALPNIIPISTHEGREYADLIEQSPALGFLAKMDPSADTIRRWIGALASLV
jgi:hypothetical protein